MLESPCTLGGIPHTYEGGRDPPRFVLQQKYKDKVPWNGSGAHIGIKTKKGRVGGSPTLLLLRWRCWRCLSGAVEHGGAMVAVGKLWKDQGGFGVELSSVPHGHEGVPFIGESHGDTPGICTRVGGCYSGQRGACRRRSGGAGMHCALKGGGCTAEGKSNGVELSMKLFIKMPQVGTIIELIVYRSNIINDLKDKVWDKMRIPSDRQIFIHVGRSLDDDQTLDFYNFQMNSTLHPPFVLDESILELKLFFKKPIN
ncbi:hypothetical protein HHK36_006710 [Tetracentron sinense]|uniref:Ubiquitin-like domain-containing protein n=1 Tax=Tetracentron sinense TaxID=13715 RepID=A0A834ZIH7_TETSI|nr:hypothetical protein HHK36_006710 [Tetracentron sinense]